MDNPLKDLVQNLTREFFNNLHVCGYYGKYYSEENLELLLRKGIFPYDWFNNYSKLDENALPPKEEFYSKLGLESISDEDYVHAQKVWKEFNCKKFREYHDLYMGLDVLQLAEVFENVQDVCQKNYKLDPAWYCTAPGLAWDALLKKTGVKLELLTDPNMLLFFEARTRGGISICSNRYGKANNPYMKGSYNPKEANKYLGYFDANNLYGYA